MEQHNRSIQELIPADQLLIYHIREGWEPLGKFLDVSIPGYVGDISLVSRYLLIHEQGLDSTQPNLKREPIALEDIRKNSAYPLENT